MKRLITLFSVICALVCVVACSTQSSPSSVAETYAKALKSENYDAITKLFYVNSDNAEEVQQSREMIKGLLTDKVKPEIDANGGITSYEVGAETISEDGTEATVDLTFVYGNGDSEEEEVELVNVDGTWYLDTGK